MTCEQFLSGVETQARLDAVIERITIAPADQAWPDVRPDRVTLALLVTHGP